MPYPNFHSCRIREPRLFRKDTFRTLRTKTKGLTFIVGRLKKTDKTELQSYRYKRADWDKSRAQKHCQFRKGRFEPAAKRSALADHAFLHSIFPLVQKDSWGGWTLREIVEAHSDLVSQLMVHSFNPGSELDCLSKIEGETKES